MAHKVANVVPGGMAIMAADLVAGDLANRVAEKVAIQVDDGGGSRGWPARYLVVWSTWWPSGRSS